MDLAEIVGLRLGPGRWMEIEANRVDSYRKALGLIDRDDVPLLFMVSLLPALLTEVALPLAAPRATINYGLNTLVGGESATIGDRVRAWATVSKIDWLGEPERSPLQIIRVAEVENQRSKVTLVAETVSRLLF